MDFIFEVFPIAVFFNPFRFYTFQDGAGEYTIVLGGIAVGAVLGVWARLVRRVPLRHAWGLAMSVLAAATGFSLVNAVGTNPFEVPNLCYDAGLRIGPFWPCVPSSNWLSTSGDVLLWLGLPMAMGGALVLGILGEAIIAPAKAQSPATRSVVLLVAAVLSLGWFTADLNARTFNLVALLPPLTFLGLARGASREAAAMRRAPQAAPAAGPAPLPTRPPYSNGQPAGPVPATRACPRCGTPVMAVSRFCAACGTALAGAAATGGPHAAPSGPAGTPGVRAVVQEAISSAGPPQAIPAVAAAAASPVPGPAVPVGLAAAAETTSERPLTEEERARLKLAGHTGRDATWILGAVSVFLSAVTLGTVATGGGDVQNPAVAYVMLLVFNVAGLVVGRINRQLRSVAAAALARGTVFEVLAVPRDLGQSKALDLGGVHLIPVTSIPGNAASYLPGSKDQRLANAMSSKGAVRIVYAGPFGQDTPRALLVAVDGTSLQKPTACVWIHPK